jgi:hypothetical protein
MVRGTSRARLQLGSTGRERVQIELVRTTTALSVAWPFEGGHLFTDGGTGHECAEPVDKSLSESPRPLALTGGHNGQLFLTEFERPSETFPNGRAHLRQTHMPGRRPKQQPLNTTVSAMRAGPVPRKAAYPRRRTEPFRSGLRASLRSFERIEGVAVPKSSWDWWCRPHSLMNEAEDAWERLRYFRVK